MPQTPLIRTLDCFLTVKMVGGGVGRERQLLLSTLNRYKAEFLSTVLQNVKLCWGQQQTGANLLGCVIHSVSVF